MVHCFLSSSPYQAMVRREKMAIVLASRDTCDVTLVETAESKRAQNSDLSDKELLKNC